MKITITGSLGNVSRPLAERLVEAGHHVTIISHNPNKANEIKSINAKPLIGSVEDISFLVNAFEGQDAVYTMIPPNFTSGDYKQFTINVRDNYATAIQQAPVRYVVNLSSVGSALAGVAPLTHYENLEESINKIPGINVLHLRPAGFYSNFYGSIPMIRHQGFIGNNFDETVMMPMSHPRDIADAAFDALQSLAFEGVKIHYIISDLKNGKEIASLLGNAIGMDDLRWVAFSDEQLLSALLGNGFSADAAQTYIIDMGKAIREGLLDKHYKENSHPVYGKIAFSDFADEFAAVYHNS